MKGVGAPVGGDLPALSKLRQDNRVAVLVILHRHKAVEDILGDGIVDGGTLEIHRVRLVLHGDEKTVGAVFRFRQRVLCPGPAARAGGQGQQQRKRQQKAQRSAESCVVFHIRTLLVRSAFVFLCIRLMRRQAARIYGFSFYYTVFHIFLQAEIFGNSVFFQ